ncbi:unnamed protein product [Phyllotreta striolata]|uniref:Uncharacterized protein n=1 Tax=Phyllotreta striolata TaxID=444603 RepID=A0A9N9XN22_PHYSR|nr:unnamed protein product [Phyllotreta striolata]
MSSDNKLKVDPGWNDPPLLNYDVSNPPPKSRILNKRVAFPLTGGISPSKPSDLPPNAPPLPVPDFTVEQAKQLLDKLFTSDKSKERFHKTCDNELPEEFQKSLRLMGECLMKNNKLGAEIHRQELVKFHKKLCESWINDVKF